MNFGLMFFAASEDSLGADKYRLVVDSARFGDRAGFSSVWVPERHFTGFGGLYPNPAVLHAGLATVTSTIRLNAGSVVAPLHHPVRIAEEWSVVDNLSNGRVGVSFASGWNPDDFLFFPDRYSTRQEQVFETIGAVQRLWRGEAFSGTNGVGQAASVKLFPRPVQRELPVWVTVAGNPKNFERAGASGANLLTHLLDQDETVLASRIALYRDARAAAGFDPATGIVSLMIHTLVGEDADVVREQARGPYCNYIKTNIGLFRGLAQSRGRDVDLSTMLPATLDEFVNFLYDRFAASRGLIGTPESCAPLVSRLEQVGVSELACLLDFGPDVDLILKSLPHLARLKDLHAATSVTEAGLNGPALRSVAGVSEELFDRTPVLQRCADVVSGDDFHRLLGRHGVRIDGAFQSVKTVWRRDGEALASLSLESSVDGYHVHPASLDACGRILAAALPGLQAEGGANYLPTGFDACDLFAPLAGHVWVHAAITQQSKGATRSFTGNVSVYDEAGRALARLGGLRLTPIDRGTTLTLADPLVYERTWHEVSVSAPGAIDASGRWLLIPDQGGLATELARQIARHGGESVTVAGDLPLRGIVYLRALDVVAADDAETAAVDGDVEHAVRGALAMAQSSGSAPIWLVTCGAAGVRTGEAINVSQAPLWGFGRAVAVERPGALGALVDLDPAERTGAAASQLLQVLTGDRSEDMVALRSGTRYVLRLKHAPRPTATPVPLAFGADDTILLTGGSGGLGLRLATWLAARGARHVLLCSRRAPTASAEAQIEKLRVTGTDVVMVQADVADYAALQARVAAATQARPITSVFHLAGVLDDGELGGQSWDRFAGVFASKVTGAWNVHRLTRQHGLKHFVLFSSVASLVPAPGQSSYAAANAFLDALAHHRRSQGLPALAVNWGPWSEAGHAQTEYGRQAHERLASLGIKSVAPDEGLRILGTLIEQDLTQAAVVAVDWPLLFRVDPAASRLGLLADLVEEATGASDAPRGPTELVATLRDMATDERRPYLLLYLSDMVVAALKLRTDDPLDPRQRLFDIGLDSIMALELKDRLERALGTPLSATLLFVRPTLDALSAYILTDIVGNAPAPAAVAGADTGMSEDELTNLLLREIDASRGA